MTSPRIKIRAALALLLSASVWLAGCVSGRDSGATATQQGGAITLSSGWRLQDAAKVTASGAAISQAGYATPDWYKATVPGTVLTSLVNNGVYPEPLYGENNRPEKIPDSLCRTSYWYRNQFTVSREYTGRHVWLNFDGINYLAEVWVNGYNVGGIKGAFARGIFDVTTLVKPGDTAVVAVKIFPPPDPGVPLEQTVANGTGRNGGVLAQDGPTFLCTMGWDWIPGIRDRDMGIWQKVLLSASGPVVLQNPLVTSQLPLPRTDEANLTVEVRLQNVTDVPQTGVLQGAFEQGAFSAPVSLAPHESQLVKLTPATTPALHIQNPRLWWPNGYGPQNLETLRLSFTVNGTVSDAQDVMFGIRQISYQVPGTDNLTISVNGVPVMCRGGDWGMDEAMKRSPRERLEAQIRLHQLANYTMIRNWVGQSTSEDFYELCDKYGILLWDEFFQPNPSDGPNPVDTDLYLANVREKVLRYRNHPSIALWCGRNEGNPPPVIDQGIRQIMNELEPTRLYQASSTDGRGVRSGGPYAWRTPRQYYVFNAAEAFKTEIGSVSIPTLESIHAMMPEKDWNVGNDDWAEHDLLKGAQRGDTYPVTLGQRYGRFPNLEDFVRKAQLANYEAFRAMYEGRFAKLFQPCSGVITWMSNPAQPSFVWQLYSHDLEPNASLFAVRKACEPIHVQMNQSDFHVMVVNQTPVALEGADVFLRVFNLDGSQKSARHLPVSAQPSAATDLGLIAFPADLSPVHFVKVELRDRQGRLLSDNFYWRATADHPDDFTALDTLPTAALAVQIQRHDNDGKCLLEVTLSNPSPAIALMAHLQLRREKSNQRVLPVYCSDNYITLLPGESRTVTIEAATKDLAGERPLVVLDGWNVTGQAQSFPGRNGGAAFAPNAAALVSH